MWAPPPSIALVADGRSLHLHLDRQLADATSLQRHRRAGQYFRPHFDPGQLHLAADEVALKRLLVELKYIACESEKI